MNKSDDDLSDDIKNNPKSAGLLTDETFKETLFSRIINVLSVFCGKFTGDSCFQMAASLTFTTLISMVPIFTLALSVLTNLSVFSGVQNWVKRFLFQFFIPTQAAVIQNYIEDFSKKITSLNAVSIVTFLLTGVFLMITVENNLHKIWNIKNKNNLIIGIVIYWAVLTLGPVLLGSSFYISHILIFVPARESHNIFYPFLTLIFSFVMSSILIFIMYYNMTGSRVRIRAAFVGALFTGLFYEILKNIFASYINHLGYYKIYGSLAVIPIFFGWLYLIWVIFLIGAEIAYFIQYPKKLNDKIALSNAYFIDEIEVFFFIIDKYYKNQKININVLNTHFNYFDNPYLEKITSDLITNQLIIYHGKRGFIPYNEPSNQNVNELISGLLKLNVIENDMSEIISGLVLRLKDIIWKEFNENVSEVIKNRSIN